MAARACISTVEFAPEDVPSPTAFLVTASCEYFNDSPDNGSIAISESVPFDATVTEINAAIIGAAVAQAPVGYECVAADVVCPNLISG